jgi:hypothetical protein
LAIGDVAHFRVVVPDAVGFQFGKELSRALLIEMLDAASTAGCHDLQPFRLYFQQLGHERTSAAFKVAQNPHFVRKALFSLRSSKRLVHPAVISDANRRSEGVLDLVHALENMAHKGAQASFEEAVRTRGASLLNSMSERAA